MPRIIDYSIVFDRLTGLGFVCNYHNSGAFSPANLQANPQALLAWVGPPDASIRPELYERIRQIEPPDAAALAALVCRAWRELFAGPAWIMPNSHWAYELEYGFRELPQLLRQAGTDPRPLRGLTAAAALEFDPPEAGLFQPLIEGLLRHMDLSDFTLALPDSAVAATLHHNQQVWWMSPTPDPIIRIDQL